MARPSPVPSGRSDSATVSGGRSPVPTELAMPPFALVIESEMIPTDTPAPVGPSARASGPLMASSPSERMLPALSRASGATIACVCRSCAAAAIAPGGTKPSTIRCGERSLTAVTRMPSARSATAARAASPST